MNDSLKIADLDKYLKTVFYLGRSDTKIEMVRTKFSLDKIGYPLQKEVISETQVDLSDFSIEEQSDLKERLQALAKVAGSLEITTEDDFKRVTALYATSREWEKKLEFARKEANQPDQARINERNDKAKEILTPLKEIQSIAKKKCDGYQLFLEKAKKAEEKRLQEAFDLIGLDEVPDVTPVEKSVRGTGALMVTRTVKKFRVIDREKVPTKYLIIDEEAIERDIKLGIDQIPGIEVYEEKTTQLRTR